jgi:hypothetical protein
MKDDISDKINWKIINDYPCNIPFDNTTSPFLLIFLRDLHGLLLTSLECLFKECMIVPSIHFQVNLFSVLFLASFVKV